MVKMVNSYLITALIPECSLKAPYIVSVPKEEGRSEMNGFCLVDVGGDEVIIS